MFNSLGQMVTELVDEFKQPGVYIVNFDGSNFASGIYYYRIVSGTFSQVNKMLLIK
ncbi:MAG: hypothetical protein IPL53_06065 [Ignavibacteria bacterium]|nr:hypothetical protein [Ignavibacteria bacterium]